MKFLIDQQLPRRLADFVRARGHEAVHVLEMSLEGAEDRAIWSAACDLGAAIISKDEDFSLIAPVAGRPQVVWVRLGNCSNAYLLSRFDAAWPQIIRELEAGAALLELR